MAVTRVMELRGIVEANEPGRCGGVLFSPREAQAMLAIQEALGVELNEAPRDEEGREPRLLAVRELLAELNIFGGRI